MSVHLKMLGLTAVKSENYHSESTFLLGSPGLNEGCHVSDPGEGCHNSQKKIIRLLQNCHKIDTIFFFLRKIILCKLLRHP